MHYTVQLKETNLGLVGTVVLGLLLSTDSFPASWGGVRLPSNDATPTGSLHKSKGNRVEGRVIYLSGFVLMLVVYLVNVGCFLSL